MRRAILLLLAAALVLSACGRKAAPTATPVPVEISFLYSQGALTAHYEALREEFLKEHPHLTVTFTESPAYEVLFRGPGGADVVDVDQTAIASLAKQGYLYPLEQVVQGPDGLDLDQFYAGTVDAMRWQGELWALPLGVDPVLLYYNKGLFAANGVAYPTTDWTWDDLLEAAMRIAAPDAEPPVWGIITDDNRADFLPLLYQGGGGLVDSSSDPPRSLLSSSASVAAMQWFVDLALVHGVMPTPRDTRGIGGRELLAITGQAGMWYGAFSERNGLSWDVPWKNIDWGATVLPAGEVRTTVLYMRACAVNAETEHPQEAWLWAKYIAEHPSSDYDAPALKSAVESDAFLAGEQADVVTAVRQSLEIGQALPAVAWDPALFYSMSRFVTDVFENDVPVEEAMVELDELLNEMLTTQEE